MESYTFKCPIGLLKICEENGRLTNLFLQEKESDIYKQINEYFMGKRKKFDLPIGCKGTVFQQQVWKELQNMSSST